MSRAPMTCGWTRRTGVFWERLGPHSSPPLLFIPGSCATGAGFRVTPDGRPGWAERLAADGYECWLSDWAGSGRSGGTMMLDVDYEDVVNGYLELLRDVIGEPTIVVCHSMGGPVAWKLVELLPNLVGGVVALAGAHPGNLDAPGEVLADDGIELTARFAPSGVTFVIRRDRPYLLPDAYFLHQGIASSRQFPRDHVEAFRQSFVPISPRLVIRRLGLAGGLPRVDDTRAFRGMWIRYVTGSEDPAHSRAIDGATVDLFRSWGADAELVWLADRGLSGNGHYLHLEDNSDDVLDAVLTEAHSVLREARR
jgi:pimeloyl-ACP methyl ester carboxylesterase